MTDRQHFKKVPLAELVSPEKAGPLFVYRDHWWAVTADDCALFYARYGVNSPQCNTNRVIVERHLNYPEPTTVKFLPWAYIQFNISDYT